MFVQLLPKELPDRVAFWPDLKQWERREIGQELRRMGLSYREVAAVIPVTKGTLSGWCRDIELSDDQRQRLSFRPSRIAAARQRGLTRREGALQRADAIRTAAAAEVPDLRRDPFWVAGAVAYWSEGDKRGKDVRFSNSDAELVRLFLSWASRYLELSPERFLVLLHLHTGQDELERQRFWSRETGLPLEQFRKSYIKPEGTGHRKNKLYNGTAQIRIRRSTALHHRVIGWLDGLRTAFVFS
jgi:hypothetical protein